MTCQRCKDTVEELVLFCPAWCLWGDRLYEGQPFDEPNEFCLGSFKICFPCWYKMHEHLYGKKDK